MVWFCRYLQGFGHPESTRTVLIDGVMQQVDIVTSAMRQKDHNPLYRCKRLLELATGLELLPQEPWDGICVRYLMHV